MGSEFIAKKGLTSLGNANISGSLTALLLSGPHTGSTFGTASSAISSSYSLFAQSSPATTIFTASTYPITSSNTITASYSLFAQIIPAILPTGSTQQITASWAGNVSASNIIGPILTSSYASFAQTYPAALTTASTQQITSSWAITSSYSTFAQTFPAALSTGSTYNITSSWAVSGGTQLATGSTVPITASWAVNASSGSLITSSANTTMFVDFSNTGSGLSPTYGNLNLTYNPATGSLFSTIFSGSQFTGSYFGTSSNTISSSYSTFAQNLPAVLPTGSTQNITSSWSISSSFLSGSQATASLFGTASWAINTVNGGSGTTLFTGSTYQITSSQALTSSYISNYSPYLTDTTSSTNWITCSFVYPNQEVILTTPLSYNFTASNIPVNGQVADIILYISHSANATSSLNFPSNWINIGSGWPTGIVANTVAIVGLRAIDSTTIIGTFNYSGSSSSTGGSGTTLFTASTYQITSSWAINTVNGGSGTTLFTGSTYPITSSWSNTSSYFMSPVTSSSTWKIFMDISTGDLVFNFS